MKKILFIVISVFSLADAFAQQSQIQAKRGIFTEWLYIKDKWINHVSTDLNSSDSASDDALNTAKATADFIRLKLSGLQPQNLATRALSATGDYTHKWNLHSLRIDSIRTISLSTDGMDDLGGTSQGVRMISRIEAAPNFFNGLQLSHTLKKKNTVTDSVASYMNLRNGTFELSTGYDNSSLGSLLSGSTSFISLEPKDSLLIRVPAVASADSVLAITGIDVFGRNTVKKAPLGVSLAGNGLSVTSGKVQLGQSTGAAGNPAQLSGNREIPMNGFGLILKDGYFRIDNGTDYKAYVSGGQMIIHSTNMIDPPSLTLTDDGVTATLQLTLAGMSGDPDDPRRARIYSELPLEIDNSQTSISYLNEGGSLPAAQGQQRVVLTDSLGTIRATTLNSDVALRPYKDYAVLLAQTGTSAPTPTILENTLGGTISWSRTAAGSYTGTLTGAFVSGKTWFSCHVSSSTGTAASAKLTRTSANQISLQVKDASNANVDGFDEICIEVRVYQ